MSVDWAALGKRFVVWRYEERGGKRTKVPYNGKGRASVRNPEGWLTYEEALVLAKRFDGVGVVLGGDLHGVDLDWKGREGVPEEVVEIIEALGSYTEWSPSGEGVHILFRGQFAPVASRGLLPSGVGVEIYVYSSPGGRFFTLTERCWEGKCVLREASEERLRSLAARVLPEAFVRYLEAHPEVKALWRGEWEERYPSQSEADLALASHLLRFTRGDKGEADRLFRLSGLYRPKWDEDRGGRTYGEMTLDRAGGRSSSSPSRSEGGSKLDAALSLLRSRVSLWRTEDREVFADLPGGRSYRVRDGRFRAWALGQMRAEGVLLRGSEWSDLVLHLEADGDQAPEFPLFVRVAGYGGDIYLDLGEGLPVVRIYPGGWDTLPLEEAPVRFVRSPHAGPLPLPDKNGDPLLLRRLLNLPDEEEGEEAFTLLLAWLLGTLNPRGPYPTLLLKGERGAGKSTTAKLLKMLVDPGRAPLRAIPKRDPKDLMVAARWSWILAFDNISELSLDLSDTLCRLATGEGFVARRLFTDAEEEVAEYARPVVLTSVVDPMTQPDLIDRSLAVSLVRVPEDERKPEEEVWGEFTRLHSAILGGLLNLVAWGLASQETLSHLPRMADFTRFVYRALSPLNLHHKFLAAYERSREALEVTAVHENQAISTLVSLVQVRGSLEGFSQEILEALEEHVGYKGTKFRPKGWPSSPVAFGRLVQRFRSSLRALGIEVEVRHTKEGRRFLLYLKREEVVKSPGVIFEEELEGADLSKGG